jgi:hypothetical protein
VTPLRASPSSEAPDPTSAPRRSTARGTARHPEEAPAGGASDRPPPCVLCGRRDRRQTRPHHLTHGYAVWLCTTHRSVDYLRRDGGRCFVRRLGEAWAAGGSLCSRRIAALRAHLRRVPPPRPLPGSYSWPRARSEAERRFAAGEDTRSVIRDIRTRYAHADAIPPSVRTMRRWFGEARWMAPAPPTTTTPRSAGAERGRRRRGIHALQARLPEPFDRWPFWPWGWWPIE